MLHYDSFLFIRFFLANNVFNARQIQLLIFNTIICIFTYSQGMPGVCISLSLEKKQTKIQHTPEMMNVRDVW